MKRSVRPFRLLCMLTLALASLQCSSDNLTLPIQGVPAHIALVSGDRQTAEVGTPLADSLIVRLTDSQDRPVSDTLVAFQLVGSNPGTDFVPDTARTDLDGRARAKWILGHTMGDQEVEARVVAGTLKTAFQATAVAGPAATISAIRGDQQTGEVGTALADSLVVKVTDQFGNPVSGTSVDWTVTGGGSVSAASVLTGTDGRAAVQRTLGNTAGAQSAQADAPGLAGSPLVFTSTATAGSAVTMVKDPVTDGQFGPAGFELTDSIVVIVKDVNGNGVPGKNVLWTVATGGGSVLPSTSVTDVDGKAFTRWTLGSAAGTNTVNAASANLTSVTFSATANAAQPAKVAAASAVTQSGTAGSPVPTPPSVKVTDANGNPVRGETVTFTVTAGGGDLSDGTNTATTVTIATDASGIATLSAWTLGATAGNNSVAASALGLTGSPLTGSPVFFNATAQAGSATRLVLSTQPSATTQSGVVLAVQPVVQLQDALGNPVAQSGKQVTVSVTGGGATLAGTLTVATSASGAATFSGLALSGPVASYTLTFTASGLTSALSGSIALSAGAAAQLVMATEPSSSAQSGVPFPQQPVVQVADAAGNPVNAAGFTVVAAIASGGGTLSGVAGKTTDAQGLATFTDLAITGAPGPYTLSFSAAPLTGVTSAQIALGAGNATKLGMATQPSASAQSGSVLGQQPTVQLQDAGGNPVPDPGVMVHVTVSTGGTLGGTDSAATDANGLATFSGLSITGPAANYTLQFTAPSLTGVTSTAIALTAGMGTQLTITTQPSAAAQSGVPFPQQPVIQLRDDGLNEVHQSGVPITAGILTGPGGVLTQATITVQTDANGVATFTGLILSGALGSYTIQFAGPSQPAVVGNPIVLSAGPAKVLVVVTPPSASVQSGIAFPQQPVVRIEDGTGNPVSQAATVTTSIASGGGTLGGTTSVNTSASGVATFTNLAISGTVGPRTLDFTATGLTKASANVDLTAGAAATLAIQAGDNQTATAGSQVAVDPAVLVTDAGGNPVAGVAVTFAVATGGGTIGAPNALTTASGIAVVGGWTLGTLAGPNTLTATAAGLSGSPATFHATGTPGSAGKLAISQQPSSSAQSGAQFGQQPKVQLQDLNGNNLTTDNVPISASASAGTLNGNTTVLTVGGIATFSGLSISGPVGNYALTFGAPSITGVTSNGIALTAGAATKLVVTTQPSNPAQSGFPFPQQPVVQLQDAAGNPAPTTKTIFATLRSGGGALGGTTSLSTGGGSSVSFTNLAVSGAAGPRTLLFSASGLTSDTSATFTLIAGVAAQIAANSPVTQSATVSTPVASPPSVIVKDGAGNPVAGVTVTFAIALGGGSLNGPTQITDATGVATVSDWTLGPATGSNTVTATATGSGISGNPVSFTATGTAGNASTIALNAGNGQSGAAGSAVAVAPSVKVTDAGGNPVQGIAVIFAVASGGGSIIGGNATTNSTGLATVGSWTLGTLAGANTLQASATGLSGSPVTFTATGVAGPPTAGTSTATVPAGTAGQITVISIVSRDQHGNLVSSGGATVAATVTGANSATATVTDNGDGTYTARYTPTATGTDQIAITLNGTAIGGSPYSSLVSPAAATKLAFVTQPTTVTAGQAISPAVRVAIQDAGGNTITSSTAPITLAIGSNPGGATLSGGGPIAAVNGIATFPALSLDHSGAGYTLVATSAPLTPATSTGFTVNAGAADQLGITTQPSATAQSGAVFGTQPVIQLRDALGNPVSQANVSVTVVASGGTLGGTASAQTNASGVATFSGLSLSGTVGNYTLTFQASGLTSATSNTIALSAGPATTIVKSAGDGQSAAAGSTLPVDPAVLVTDAAGNPVAGRSVTFAVASGGGSLTGGNATSDVNGIATVGSWTLGVVAGPNTLTATSAGLSGSPLTFTATGTTGAATQLVVTTQPSASAQSGVPFGTQPVVQLRDANNNNVSQSGINVTVAIAAGGGSLGGTPTVTTNGSGQAVFAGLSISDLVGAHTLQFTSTGLSTATSNTINLTAGLPADIALSAGNNQTATVGTAVAVDPAVLVTDASGNPVGSVAVTFSVLTGGGSVSPTTPVSTTVSGIATVTSWTLGSVAGPNTLRATSGSLNGSPVTFTANGVPGNATRLAVETQPSANVQSGVVFPQQPVIQLEDASGNPVTQAGVQVTASIASGGGSLGGNNVATTNASGLATFNNLSISGTVGTRTLSFTATTFVSVNSGNIVVAAGPAGTLAKNAGDGQTAPAGTAVAVDPAVLVTDASGNPVANVSVTFAVATGGGSITGGAATTNASGIATVGSWTLGNTAGSNSLTATSAGLTGSPATFTAAGSAGVAHHLTITTQPSATAQSGIAFPQQPVVQLRDQFGNSVSQGNVGVTAAIASGGGTLNGTATVQTNASGVATFAGLSITDLVGPHTLGFSSGALTGVTSGPITLNAGSAATMAKSAGDGQSAAAGSSLPVDPAVLVTDGAGNPVVGRSVTFAVATGGGSLTGGNAISDVNGIATVGSWTLGAVAGPNTLTATSAGLTGSPLTFTATGTTGAANHLAITTQPSATAQSGIQIVNQPVVQLRDGNNNNVSQANVNVTATVSVGGNLTGTLTVPTNGSGAAVFDDLVISGLVGNYTLSFTSGSLTPATSNTIALGAGTATKLGVNRQPSTTAQSGVAIAVQPRIQIQDAAGNSVSQNGTTITASFASGTGTLTNATAVTNAGGLATFAGLTISGTVGSYTLQYDGGGLTDVTTNAITLNPGSANHVSITVQPPTSASSGVALSPQPVLQLRDGAGNAVSQGGTSITASIASGTGGSLSNTVATTDAGGEATFTNLTLSGTAGNFTLSFGGTGLTPAVSNSIALGAGSGSVLTITTQPSASAQNSVAFGQQPVIQLRDGSNNPVNQPGVLVTAQISTGGGSLTGSTSATTNSSGVATFSGVEITGTIGSRTLIFSANGFQAVTSASINITPGPATQLAITTAPSSTVQSGVAFPTQPVIQLRDQSGNNVSQNNVSVNVAIASGGGTLGGTFPVNTNGSGQAVFTNLNISGLVGNRTLTFSSGSLSTATTGQINVTAGPADELTITTQPSANASSGTPFPQQPVIQLRDAAGNAVSQAGVSVDADVATGSAVLSGNTTVTTNGSGVAAFTNLELSGTAGANILAFSSTGLTGVNSAAINLGAGSATKLSITTQPSASAQNAIAFPQQPAIQLRDAANNPVSQASVPITVAIASGGGSLTGSTVTVNTTASGLATFTNLRITDQIGNHTLSFSSGSLTPATSGIIDLNAGNATTIAASAGDGQSATAGTAVPIDPEVLVTDVSGNPVQGESVTFAVASGGGTVVPTSAILTDASGNAAATSWTLGTTAGPNTLTATSTGLNGSPVTFDATGTAGAATKLTITTQPSSSAQNAIAFPQQPAIQLRDGANNPVSQLNVPITVAIATGGGSLGVTTTVNTTANGLATFTNLRITDQVGNHTLTFTSGSLTPVTSGIIDLNPGTATTIAVSAGDGQTADAGTDVAVPPEVVVTDVSGNGVSGVNVAFAVASGGGTVVPTTPIATDINGNAAVNSWTLGTTPGTNTVTATSGSLNGSPVTFTATGVAGAPAKFTLTTQPSSTAQNAIAFPQQPVLQLRDASNNPVSQNGVPVTASILSGGGSLGGSTLTINTDFSGEATFPDLDITGTVGNHTLRFTSSFPAVTSSTINLTAGDPTSIVAQAGNNQNATVGTAVAVDPRVLIRDVSNNPVPNIAVTFAVQSGGGNATGLNPSTDNSGLAAVGSWTLGSGAGSNTLRATSGTLTGSPVTFDATGNPDAADAGQSTATVPDGTVSQQTVIAIQARDQFDNALTTGGSDVEVTVSGTNTDSMTATDNGDGTYTASYLPVLPGADTITITLDGGQISGSPFTSNVGP